MTKEDIYTQLDYNRGQLSYYERRLRELKDKREALESFSRQCESRIISFENSISRRKKRVASFGGLTSTVKIAAQYAKKMNDMLTGRDFTNAISSISELQFSVSRQRRDTANEIIDVEDKITYFGNKVSDFQYQYDTYSEGEVTNG